jgi:hypothetical protein
MNKRLVVGVVLVLGLTFCEGAAVSVAQEASNPPAKAESQEAVKPVEAYRLDFSVNEMEDGKRINSRQYSMNLNGNDSNEVKIGTRVPVEAKQGEFQYLDVGTSIYGRLSERRGQLELTARAEISNFAIPEQNQGQNSHPVLRQLKINASTLALLGKPMVMGSVDDPNSKRQFQLEVTVTKLR